MTLVAPARDVAAERAAIEAAIEGKTLLSAFAETADRLADTDALAWKDASGAWQKLTWRQYREAVAEVAVGLTTLGFEPGQFAILLSRNRPEPLIAELGTQHARGAPVVLYNTLASDQAAYIANHCEARVAFVENRQFLRTLQAVRTELKHLRAVVLLDDTPSAEDAGWTMTFEALRARGREVLQRDPAAFEALWKQVGPGDLAALVYTSGTTGRPKGVMLSQRNVMWEAASVAGLVAPRTGERTISYLPLAHVTGRWLDLWSQIVYGGTVYCCPDPLQLFQYAAEVRPTGLVGVPRVWEKLYAALLAGIAAEPDAARRQAVEQAIAVRRQVIRLEQSGERIPPELAAAAERAAVVGQMVRARVGLEQCDRAATGAAPIDPGIIEFFQAIGLPMIEAWGMTELTCAATGNPSDAIRNGSIGVAGPGVEVRLADDGEIVVRAGLMMEGYYKDPEATAETIDPDGWLHTGDLASVDKDGYFRIIGRKKELIITAGGKNIAPAAIEFLLEQHPLIGQACAIGDRRPYVNALLVLDPERAPAWARQHDIEAASPAELTQHPTVLEEVQRAVDAANTHLARVEQVKRFRLLPTEWTAQTGELTPTLKKRRNVILERYADVIEALYAVPAAAPATQQSSHPAES
ncbi:MAG TPA: AMP-dependent synthetase/ligase [Chloroflexota bacterium]|nr:AMP-dependent synthetase/ligase [Chloroflexota bacterium]